jgi:hypothetical protein
VNVDEMLMSPQHPQTHVGRASQTNNGVNVDDVDDVEVFPKTR